MQLTENSKFVPLQKYFVGFFWGGGSPSWQSLHVSISYFSYKTHVLQHAMLLVSAIQFNISTM
jgi:hypothetical protein